MLEIVVSSVGGRLLQISQNGFRPLDSKVTQQSTAALPKFEIGRLDQVLHQRARRLAPPRGGAHNGEADGPSDPRNELLPGLVIARFGAEAHDVFSDKDEYRVVLDAFGILLFRIRILGGNGQNCEG